MGKRYTKEGRQEALKLGAEDQCGRTDGEAGKRRTTRLEAAVGGRSEEELAGRGDPAGGP